jgi:hypothetical protein
MFCCLACRLLQEPATNCIECDSHLMTAVEAAKPLLVSRSFEPKPRGAWPLTVGGVAAYVAVIASAVTWFPAIPIAAGAAGAAIGVTAWRRRGALATLPLLEPAIGDGAVARRGVAHKLDGTIDSIVDGKPVLVEEATLLLRGRVVFRRIRVAPFLLAIDGGERAVVTGVVRVCGTATTQTSPARNPRLTVLGIPPRLRPAGELHTHVVRDGDAIRVTGESAIEIVPELAFHRDAGETTVIRGRAGSVVIIDA